MMKVLLLDLGLGNLLSIRRGLERAGGEVAIIDRDPESNRGTEPLVLPGVGAFRDGILALGNFSRLLGEVRDGSRPLLGICLGMQLLFSRSYEGGEYEGLNLIKGEVVRLPSTVKVPQMGWNSIRAIKDSYLLNGLDKGEFFYFVHSYYCMPTEDVTIADCDYGYRVPAIVQKRMIYGTQFHPEKSGEAGQRLLTNFLEVVRR